MYILLTALTSYLFNTKTERAYTGLFKDDAYPIKLLYWPVYFFVLLFITWVNFRQFAN